MKKIRERSPEKVWIEFQRELGLSSEELDKFKKYNVILREWNKKFNLTAITNLGGVIRQHFLDSLAFKQFMDLKEVKSIADIGPGAGFPAIPLKILFPHLHVYLIEVNQKKQKFLRFLVDSLKLENVEIVDIDWRTFLRKTEFDIDFFVTRASLHDIELIRMFKPSCFYRNSQIVYWGAIDWLPYSKAEKYIKQEKIYKLGKKERKLVFFGL